MSKIVKIEQGGIVDKVYDIEVPQYHNFAIGKSGVIVHNSGIHTMPAGASSRKYFTSRFKGGILLQPDYSSNELRCVASYAQEESMLKAFAEGKDIHRANATMIFGVPYEDVTKYQRRFAKTLSFSLIYGAGPYSVAQNYFDGDVPKAEAAIEKFYQTFPKLKIWMEKKQNEALATGKVGVMTHRFLKMDCNRQDKKDVARMLRVAVNGPVQSYEGSVKIRGLDGQDYSIRYLADRKMDLWTYACNVDNHRIIPVKGINAQCTGTTDTWYEITLSNDEKIKVTPEHLMMLHDGEYIRADKLRVGNQLKSIAFSNANYRYVTKDCNNVISWDVVANCYPYLKLHAKDRVHHINLIYTDNTPDNLIRINHDSLTYYLSVLKYCIKNKVSYEDYKNVLESYLKLTLCRDYMSQDVDILLESFQRFHRRCAKGYLSYEKLIKLLSHELDDNSGDIIKSFENHKVKSINVIHLDNPEPKYDLHIPRYQNFALSAGVFAHNSAASSVAAIVFCDVIQFMRNKCMKSKPICFIHDSLETDIYPYELLEIIEYQEDKLANGAMEYFGLALKADVSMGINMGEDVEMKSLEILDDNKTKGYITLSGYKDEIENLIETWKLVYYKVDIIEEEWTPEFISLSQYYIPRKAFDPFILAHRESGSCKIYIQYYNDSSLIDPVNKTGEPVIHGTWDNFPLYEYFGKE